MRSFPYLLLIFAIVLGSGTQHTKAQSVSNAGEFLIAFGQNAARELNDPNLSTDARTMRFRQLFNEAVDIPTISKFILGPYWRQANESERASFMAAFEDIAVQRFLPIFTRKSDEYKGNSFDIVDQRPVGNRADQVLVYSRVERPEGPPVELAWRVRNHDGAYKILDITVQGISMALTLRDEYGAVAKRLGGVGPLVQRLREKLNEGAYAPKALGSAQSE